MQQILRPSLILLATCWFKWRWFRLSQPTPALEQNPVSPVPRGRERPTILRQVYIQDISKITINVFLTNFSSILHISCYLTVQRNTPDTLQKQSSWRWRGESRVQRDARETFSTGRTGSTKSGDRSAIYERFSTKTVAAVWSIFFSLVHKEIIRSVRYLVGVLKSVQTTDVWNTCVDHIPH